MIALKLYSRKMFLAAALHLALFVSAGYASALEITPFHTFNQNPLVQIFGLPAAESAHLVERGRLMALLTADAASNYAVDDRPPEHIHLDGEIYRTTLALRYGAGKGIEVGLDIPYVIETGGFLDASIQWWHTAFGLPQGGRDQVPHNRLLFSYERNGVERFHIDHSNDGIGDIRLSGALQLYRSEVRPGRAAALRASLKLPTGDSALLHGSGGTDFALWLSAADDYPYSGGHFAVFGAAGGMALSRGDVLRELQRNLVAFGTLGVGWSPSQWLALKAQLNGNTPFYRNSSLRELAASAQLVAGGTIAFSEKSSLDLGFSEDILVISSSPDIVFNIALRQKF